MVGVACHFQLGAVPRAKIEDLWEGISPGFRLVSDRHWIYLTLASFGLLVLAPRGERGSGHTAVDCRTLDLFVFAMCRVVLICLSGISFFLSLMVVRKYNKTGLCLFLPCCKCLFFALED